MSPIVHIVKSREHAIACPFASVRLLSPTSLYLWLFLIKFGSSRLKVRVLFTFSHTIAGKLADRARCFCTKCLCDTVFWFIYVPLILCVTILFPSLFPFCAEDLYGKKSVLLWSTLCWQLRENCTPSVLQCFVLVLPRTLMYTKNSYAKYSSKSFKKENINMLHLYNKIK